MASKKEPELEEEEEEQEQEEQEQYEQYEQYDQYEDPAPSRRSWLRAALKAVAVIAALLIFGPLISRILGGVSDDVERAIFTLGGVNDSSPAKSVGTPETTTNSRAQALKKAQSYLRSMAFSRSGLIGQLEYDGFSTADATAAVDSLSVDWSAQAVKKAQSYLRSMAFSRSGLIRQLEYEGFSTADAKHAADAVGLTEG